MFDPAAFDRCERIWWGPFAPRVPSSSLPSFGPGLVPPQVWGLGGRIAVKKRYGAIFFRVLTLRAFVTSLWTILIRRRTQISMRVVLAAF